MEEYCDITKKGWHVLKYLLFAQNPNNLNEIFGVNLLTESCFKITQEEFNLLFKLSKIKENNPSLKKLIQQGIVINFDEKAIIEAVGRKNWDISNILRFSLCPTMDCNFRCPYCFEDHRHGKMTQETQDDIFKLINKITENKKIKKINITWFGGEPLLTPDIIESFSKRLINYCNDKNIIYSANIVTNGYLLTQEIANMLKEAKVFKYQITLDGVGKKHDVTRHLVNGNPTFDKIIQNLSTIKIDGIILIRHNIYNGNQEEIQKLRKYISEIKEKSGNNLQYYFGDIIYNDNIKNSNIEILPIEQFGKIKILESKINLSKKIKCCAAQDLDFITIDEKGRLFKCRDNIRLPEFSFGDVKNWDPFNPLFTAIRPNMITSYINTIGAWKDKECQECVWLPLCGGGCPNQRIYYKKHCISYKGHEEDFVLKVAKQFNYL